MPKKSKINPEDLVEIIKKYSVFNENSNILKGPSQECWSLIQNDMKHIIDSKYIYTIVLQNRYGIADKIKSFNENKSTYLKLNSDDDKNVSFEAEELSDKSDTSEKEDKLAILNFNITLSPSEWNNLFDEYPKNYKRSDGRNMFRSYFTLKPYKWTSIINEHFFEQTKLSCCISYKRSKLHSGENFLTIDGSCSSCHSNMKGKIENQPVEGSRVIIRCTLEGAYNTCTTRKKRRMIGEKKNIFLDKLLNQNMSAAYIQRTEAKTIMEYEDPEPSHLPSLNALRVLKYKENKKTRLGEDQIIAIAMMKGIYPYNNIIKDIGYDRFFLHYWTAPEINSYRNYCKRSKLPTISIDTTGGIVKKIALISGRYTGSLFLYQIGVMDQKSNSQFAVAHMISERHDNNSISHWLTEWVRSGINTPKIVVVDQSLALMIAAVRSFTQYSSLNKYIDVCSSLLMNDHETEVPLCMIRNDFNHVMHLISTWPELKSNTFRFKNFYLRSIGLLIVSTDFNDVKNLLKMIFTVALHETDENNFMNEPTQCEVAKSYLKQRIATHTTDFYDFNTRLEDNDKSDKDTILEKEESVTVIDSSSTIFSEIKNIYEFTVDSSEFETNNTGDRDNMQFCPPIAKRLLDFCKLIPCWSALMLPFFKYGNLTETSSSSESLFKDLKNVVFKHKSLPLRLDEFLKIHINSILGSMNILSDKTGQTKQIIENERKENINISGFHKEVDEVAIKLHTLKSVNEDKTTCCENLISSDDEMYNIGISEEIFNLDDKTKNQCSVNSMLPCDEIQFKKDTIDDKETKITISSKKRNSMDTSYDDCTTLENWKGLGYQTGKKKKKGTYLDKDPSVLNYNDTSCNKGKVIGLLKNGNCSDLSGVQIDNKFYSVTNTCAFDSIFQIICSSYVDSNVYAEWINSNTTDKFFKVITDALRDGINSQTYKMRAVILKYLMSENRHFKETPDGLVILDSACTANYLFQKLFEKYPSCNEKIECLFCGHIQIKSYTTLTANLPTKNIYFLLDVLKNTFEEDRKCTQCKSISNKTLTFGSHLFIEPVHQKIEQEKNKLNFDLPVILKDVPTTLKLFDKQFNLKGLISFIPPKSKSMGAIGHYVSYNWREMSNTWERCDDLLHSIRYVRPSTTVHCQLLIYTL